MLRRRSNHPVTVEPGGAIVRKSFLGTGPLPARAAAEEYARLERFAAAVVSVEDVTCPRPVELVSGPVPAIRMERVVGTPLLEVLRSSTVDAGERNRLAAIITRAVQAYVEVVGEPYFDLQFDNMLVVPGRSPVAFVDFGVPDGGGTDVGELSALAISVGNLIGSTVFQSARPKWLLARRQHAQAAGLCAAVVDRVVDDADGRVSARGLRTGAELAYRRSAFAGGIGRTAWYASGGYLVARRLRATGVVFGPCRPLKGPLGPSAPGGMNRK